MVEENIAVSGSERRRSQYCRCEMDLAAKGLPVQQVQDVSEMSSVDDWEDGSGAGSIDIEEALAWWGHQADDDEYDGERALLFTNTCIRCGRQVLLEGDVAEEGILFCCDLVRRECDQVDERAGHNFFLQCCSLCGESHVLAVDFATFGLDFRCGLAGLSCNSTSTELEHIAVGSTEPIVVSTADCTAITGDVDHSTYLQQCSLCRRGFYTPFDLAALGIDFRCSLAGKTCWESTEEHLQHSLEVGLDGFGTEFKTSVLSLVEHQRLLAKSGSRSLTDRSHQFALERGVFKHRLRHQGQDIRERFRDNAVVCSQGEKFITINKTPSPGPGTALAGIIGSSSRGRMGLGLRKMTKEESEKYKLSSKERGHIKKKVAHAKTRREHIEFETKSTMHQMKHATVLPASVVR